MLRHDRRAQGRGDRVSAPDAEYDPIQDRAVSQLHIPELHNHFAEAFAIIQNGATASLA